MFFRLIPVSVEFAAARRDGRLGGRHPTQPRQLAVVPWIFLVLQEYAVSAYANAGYDGDPDGREFDGIAD